MILKISFYFIVNNFDFCEKKKQIRAYVTYVKINYIFYFYL